MLLLARAWFEVLEGRAELIGVSEAILPCKVAGG
jgi:hypothetical protein